MKEPEVEMPAICLLPCPLSRNWIIISLAELGTQDSPLWSNLITTIPDTHLPGQQE